MPFFLRRNVTFISVIVIITCNPLRSAQLMERRHSQHQIYGEKQHIVDVKVLQTQY